MQKLILALPDALIVAGAAAVAYGAWLIYAPAGFIVGGILALAGGVIVDSKLDKKAPE
jgi:hypothetical protein